MTSTLTFWRYAPSGGRFSSQALRYIIAGVTCAFLSNALLIGLTKFGVPYLVAATAAIPPMLSIGFVLQRSFVFRGSPTSGGFIRYALAMLSNQPLSLASLYTLCDLLGTSVAVAGPVTTIVLFVWNFYATRWALSSPKRRPDPAVTTQEAPRRIAIVIDAVMPWHKGGRETFIDQLCRRLAKPDQEVHIYTMNWWRGPSVTVRDGIYFHAICKHLPLYRNGRRSTRQAVWFALSIFKLLFEPFDVLHVDHIPYFPLFSARIVASLKRRRLTASWYEFWGSDYWRDYFGGIGGRVGDIVERASIRLPNAIASCSDHTTQRLLAAGARCPVETISLGVDAPAIASAPPADTQSDIIFVGRLIDHKGVDLLIEAVSILRRTRSNLSALIVGTGPSHAKLQQMAEDLGLETNIRFLGEVAVNGDVHGLMKSSRLLALPSRREGFGLVVLEANAAGIPVVTLECADNAAAVLIRDGVNGFLCEPSAPDLADKIERTLSSGGTLRPAADIQQYGWDMVANRMDAFLRLAGAESGL
jgi:glycosyltransferase involved in cell wall biosynthesis/putative flippase GtrA